MEVETFRNLWIKETKREDLLDGNNFTTLAPPLPKLRKMEEVGKGLVSTQLEMVKRILKRDFDEDNPWLTKGMTGHPRVSPTPDGPPPISYLSMASLRLLR